MSCPSCTDIPRILGEVPRNSACKRVEAAFPNCVCEQTTVCPELSPGPVQDDETIARFVPSEHYYDEDTKKVLTNLFEAASQNGMSVTRTEKAGDEHLLKQQSASRYYGFVSAKVGDIRAILNDILDSGTNQINEQKRAFAVYDTALPENACHADVCQTVMNPGAISVKLRVRLRDAFDQNIRNFSIPIASE